MKSSDLLHRVGLLQPVPPPDIEPDMAALGFKVVAVSRLRRSSSILPRLPSVFMLCSLFLMTRSCQSPEQGNATIAWLAQCVQNATIALEDRVIECR